MKLTKAIAEKWWVQVIRGLLMILVGLYLIAYPVKSVVLLTTAMGLWAMVEGCMVMLMALIMYREVDGWGLLFFQGILALALGLFLLALPITSLAAIMFLVGLWSVGQGIVLAFEFMQLRDEGQNTEVMLLVVAILSMVFGLLLMGNVQTSIAVAGLMMSVMFISVGLVSTAIGYRIRLQK